MQRTQSANKRTNERTNNRNETKRNERMNRRTRRRVATCRVATCCDATCRDATRRDPTCREDFLTYFGHSWYFESDSFKCHHVRWYCISMAYERGGTSGWQISNPNFDKTSILNMSVTRIVFVRFFVGATKFSNMSLTKRFSEEPLVQTFPFPCAFSNYRVLLHLPSLPFRQFHTFFLPYLITMVVYLSHLLPLILAV